MSTLEAQIQEAERRSREGMARRLKNEALFKQGAPFLADTPERVRLWFRRRGISQDVAERAVKTGDVPLEAQEALKARGLIEQVGLERVLGTSDLLGVAFLERGLQTARTVGRISIRGRTGSPVGYGTGFMVSPRLLMTNNHVLDNPADAADSVAEFDYYVQADGTPATIKVFSLQPEQFFKTDAGLDFTLVAVSEVGANGTPLSLMGWNQLIPEEGKAIIGQWVNIIQHPNGEPKQLVLRNNEIVDTPEQFLSYVADTSPGSSGSPVYNDRWEVVALHHAGVPARDEAGNIQNIRGQPWQAWMGEHQVKWTSNEGARVSRIVAHVTALPLTAQERALFMQALQRPPVRATPTEFQPVQPSVQTGTRPTLAPDGTVTWTLPLRISLSLGDLAAPAAAGSAALPTPFATALASPAAEIPAIPAMPAMPSSEKALLESARTEFLKRPEVLDVRLGYFFAEGWITSRRAIVVTVDQKKNRFDLQRSGQMALPQSFGGYPIQLSEPTLRQLLNSATARSAEFFALPDKLRAEEIVYAPPNIPLATVDERMQLTLHMSPDAGWPCLKAFIADSSERLVIGMYDFGAPHILDAILAQSGLKELVLVMQRGESLGTGTKKDDRTDSEVAQALSDRFGERFHFGWVKLGIKNGWVANSYHIKVAVQDSKAFWLSSGNWQSSNQPAVDLSGSQDFSYFGKYNREWHAIVHHAGLAKTFEAYLRHDLNNGSSPDFAEAFTNLPNLVIPALEARRPVKPPAMRYFAPLVLDEKIRVTPLLTPDNYFDATMALIRSAKQEILLQNQTFNAPAEHQDKLAELVGLLREKQKRIPVRIVFRLLMPSDARKNLEALIDMGFNPEAIRVQPNLHTKGIIVDGKKVLLGSQNISETGISLNRDASLLFEHAGIAAYFREAFEHDWENLALKDIGTSVKPARATSESTLADDEGVLFAPKDYLPLL